MVTYKRIVCLANSRKHGRICIAGIELGWKGELLGWIRPTGLAEDGALYLSDVRTQDGREPALLDVVQIPFFRHYPVNHQPENWAISEGQRWQRKERFDLASIHKRALQEGSLWGVGHSTQGGMNDRLPLSEAIKWGNSLQLAGVQNFTIQVADHYRSTGEKIRRMRSTFTANGVEYRLWVTDRACEAHYLPKADGEYPIGDAILTVSLGEPLNGYCYKLVAGVLLPPETTTL